MEKKKGGGGGKEENVRKRKGARDKNVITRKFINEIR
jgi:hypothetical protein